MHCIPASNHCLHDEIGTVSSKLGSMTKNPNLVKWTLLSDMGHSKRLMILPQMLHYDHQSSSQFTNIATDIGMEKKLKNFNSFEISPNHLLDNSNLALLGPPLVAVDSHHYSCQSVHRQLEPEVKSHGQSSAGEGECSDGRCGGGTGGLEDWGTGGRLVLGSQETLLEPRVLQTPL